MTQLLRRCTALLTLLSPLPLSAAPALPDWLVGRWCGEQAGRQTEEAWLAPAGGMMLGVARSIGKEEASFEYLRIVEVDGVPAYIAQPQGHPPTVFKLTAAGADWVRFENPQHDFPQRIEYRRNGDALHAEIGGPGDAGKETVIDYGFQRCGAF